MTRMLAIDARILLTKAGYKVYEPVRLENCELQATLDGIQYSIPTENNTVDDARVNALIIKANSR